MLRILQQFILTSLFAVFASQASAMFIQADTLDPTQPGVGTNRYAYSANNPINLRDPSGESYEPDGTDYGVDTNGDGVPDAFAPSGYGVGDAQQARSGDPIIQGNFASGSQFAGFPSSVRTRQQATSLANRGITVREAAQEPMISLNEGPIQFGHGVQDSI